MKVNFILTILTILLCQICAISQTYQVSVSQRPYTDLVGGHSLAKGVWDELEFELPLGFSLALFNDTIESLYSTEIFAGGYVVSDLDLSETNVIVAFSSDLIDRGYEIDSTISPVTYKIEGVPGNKKFILEYENAGFWSGELENGIYTDFINYQMIIYESSGDIEIHIGPYSVLNPGLDFEGFTGPNIGLLEGFSFDNDEFNGEICMIAGDPLLPDVITEPFPASLIWPIPVNTVYRFYRPTSKVSELNLTEVDNYYFPNPTSDRIQLQAQFEGQVLGPVRIINSTGATVYHAIPTDIIEMSDLPFGIYQLLFTTNDGMAVQRIIKINK